MKTASISEILYCAYSIIDNVELSGESDATMTGATVNFNVNDEPYTLYIGGSGSVTIHSYNDEIEVPF